MPSSGIELMAIYGLGVLAMGLGAYAAYWAFILRRALAIPLYRDRALWTGVFALMWASVMLSTTPDSPIVLSYLHTAFIDAIFFPVLLAWIDSTIRVAAYWDLLHRDTLYWAKLRKPIWIAIGASVLFSLIGVTGIVTGLPWEALLYGPFFAVLPYGLVALVISVARTHDPLLRGHLRWFAYFMATMVIIMILYIPRISLLLSIGFAFGSYFLYRMAKSLTPISHLLRIDEP
jgi:hypothetical protein